MTLRPPPPVTDLGVSCIVCRPEGGVHNVYCERHLHQENARPGMLDAEVEFSHVPSAQTVIEKVIEARYRDADAATLWDELDGADVRHDGVLLHGVSGSGKTHQAALLVRRAIERSAAPHHSQFAWTNAATLLEDMRADQKLPAGNRPTVDRLTAARVLVLDDLGTEKPSTWVRERLYEIVNRRYERMNGGVVVTTNLNPAQLEKQLGARITGRLMQMCSVIAAPDVNWRKPAA